MSGTCIESFGKFFSEEEAWAVAKQVRDSVNATSFDELRSMDLQVICDTFSASMEQILPAIDGYVFPLSTLDLVKNGYMNGESTMIGTVFRESFTEKPFNMGKPPQSLDELNEYYFDKLFDTQAKLIQKYYPEQEIKTKIWPHGVSEFDDNVASLIQTVQSTDCWVKCGSIWQADMMAMHPMIKDRATVYFYQYGYIEKPWDQVSHGYDMVGLFGMDVDWVSGGVAFSEEFVEITQTFFGEYIRGNMDEALSVQNGNYFQIADAVWKVPMSDMDIVRERCEVYKLFGDAIWRNPFCIGIYPKDWTAEDFKNMMDAMNANATESESEGNADKQEI